MELTWEKERVAVHEGVALLIQTSAGLHLLATPQAQFDQLRPLCMRCPPYSFRTKGQFARIPGTRQMVAGCGECGEALPRGRAVHYLPAGYSAMEDWFLGHTELDPLGAEVFLRPLFAELLEFWEELNPAQLDR